MGSCTRLIGRGGEGRGEIGTRRYLPEHAAPALHIPFYPLSKVKICRQQPSEVHQLHTR